jgi:hypothetical protein
MNYLVKFFLIIPLIMLFFLFPNCNQPTALQSEKGDSGTAGAMGNVVTEWHSVGAANEPTFANDWKNVTTSNTQPLQFGLDGAGFLHIVGTIVDPSPDKSSVVFLLPVSFRPSSEQNFGGSGIDYSTGAIINVTICLTYKGTMTVTASTGYTLSTVYIGHIIAKMN